MGAVGILLTPCSPAWSALFPRLGLVLVAYALVCALQRVLRPVSFLHRARVALNGMALAGLALLFAGPALAAFHPAAPRALRVAFVLFGAMAAVRLADILYCDHLAPRRRRAPVPVVLRDIVRAAVAALLAVVLIKTYFPEVNLNVLAVSSIVVGYIVGNATQDTLGNLIAGVALNSERPFEIGDWITTGSQTGQVVDITWRATRLRTKQRDYVIIPNAAIGRDTVVNHSRPTAVHGLLVGVGASYDAAPNHVRRVLLEILADTPAVLKEPAPQVWLVQYGDFSINYEMKFYLEDFEHLEIIRSNILDLVWYRFRREGIGIPFPIRDVRLQTVSADTVAAEQNAALAARVDALGAIDLFQSLSREELRRLAALAREQSFAAGEALVRQGEAGGTFFAIRGGRVAVSAADAQGREALLAHLEAGRFFGEMSLLTGEPRNATVRAEGDVSVLVLSKEALGAILQANPAAAEHLAGVLQRRLQERHERLAAAAAAQAPAPPTRSDLLGRIRRFFGLGGAGPAPA
jgi:small-conductance mechanosensitive channel/CRP-like cAMP-binding protein